MSQQRLGRYLSTCLEM